MVAVPEAGTSDAAELSTSAAGVPAHRRRLVAVTVSPMELLRPGSDLVRLIEDAAYVDLLIASEDAQVEEPSPVRVLASAEGAGEVGWDDWDDEADWDDETDWDDDEDGDEEADEVRRTANGLGLPELHLHRLGLRAPLTPAAEPDLVAALSELVGFDPEPGVYCLAPAPAPADPSRVVVDRAVQRIAKVYGLPMLRYRCLELSVVGDDEQR